MRSTALTRLAGTLAIALPVLASAAAQAQQPRHFRFAYDQPKNTGYGIVGDVFSDKLKGTSNNEVLRRGVTVSSI